jgi:serine/threonine-protein kinase
MTSLTAHLAAMKIGSVDVVRTGDVLGGKYRVERVLGMGGMGVVVEATHLYLRRSVAVKLLLPEVARRSEAVERFLREGRGLLRVQSEHVPAVFDVGVLDDGCPYLAMELLDGTTLARVLDEGPLPADVAVEYVLQACRGVAAAHAAGVIHRDLKPSNLFVVFEPSGRPCVKVLDFGVSKLRDPEELAVTGTMATLGSPAYMSPEQMASPRDVDEKTDVWALGVVLYELVTGRRPFDAESLPSLCVQVTQGATPAIRSLRPDAPEFLDDVVHRCLQKDPAKRFASVTEMADALTGAAGPQPRPRTRSRWASWLFGALTAMVLVPALWKWWPRDAAERPGSVEPAPEALAEPPPAATSTATPADTVDAPVVAPEPAVGAAPAPEASAASSARAPQPRRRPAAQRSSTGSPPLFGDRNW